MIITSQNIRGLNRKGKQSYVKVQHKKDNLDIMMVQETKIQKEKLKDIINTLKPHQQVIAIYARGSAGTLAILWNQGEIFFEGWVSQPRILFERFHLCFQFPYSGLKTDIFVCTHCASVQFSDQRVIFFLKPLFCLFKF